MSHIDIFIAVWLPSLYMHDFNKSVTFIDFAIRLLGREDFSDEKKKMLIGGEGEERVYLVKSEVLGGKSLLQYIVDNGPRMMKQREDLLDVLAKHVEIVNSDGKSLNEKQKESKIIKNLKLGLPSSTGLSECITMTEEKFPWSSIKARGMIALSVVSNLFSLALYFVDVYTDGMFVGEMLDNSKKNHFRWFETINLYHHLELGMKLCSEEPLNNYTLISSINSSISFVSTPPSR